MDGGRMEEHFNAVLQAQSAPAPGSDDEAGINHLIAHRPVQRSDVENLALPARRSHDRGWVTVRATRAVGHEAERRPHDRIHRLSGKGLMPATGSIAKMLLMAPVVILALSLQLAAFPNHDVAWVLWGTRALLQGAAWGRDIIEPNPPLAWYLAMPSTWFAGLTGIPTAAAFDVAVTLAALASIWAFDALIGRDVGDRPFSDRLPMLVAILFLLLFPYRDFGQREHLMLIAVLPYLALLAVRCDRRAGVPATAAVAIGIAAGLGFALKPYFLAAPILSELAALRLTRRWRFMIRPETLAMGAVIALYGLYVLIFCRSYVDIVVPLAQAIYWSFDVPFGAWASQLVLPGCAILAVAMIRARPVALPAISAAAALGFMISALLQNKGYSYHLLPLNAVAAIALAAALGTAGKAARQHLAGWFILAALLTIGTIRTYGWWEMNKPGGTRAVATKEVIAAIDRYAGPGGFLVVAVHPFPAFPAALYTGARQVSRTNSQWFLPAVAQIRSGTVPPRIEDAVIADREARDFILHDLARRPGLVMIDTDSRRHTTGPADFDFLAFYLEDPRFRRLWAGYREVKSLGQYRLFVLTGQAPR